MRTIETTATIADDGTLTAKVPEDIPPGTRRVTVVMEDRDADQAAAPQFPVIHVESWPADLSLRREDMYDDRGR